MAGGDSIQASPDCKACVCVLRTHLLSPQDTLIEFFATIRLISKCLPEMNHAVSALTHSSSFIYLSLFSEVRSLGAEFTRTGTVLELSKYSRNLHFCLGCFLYTLPKSGFKKL